MIEEATGKGFKPSRAATMPSKLLDTWPSIALLDLGWDRFKKEFSEEKRHITWIISSLDRGVRQLLCSHGGFLKKRVF